MTLVNMTCQLDGKIKIKKTILALIDFCVRHLIKSNDNDRLIKKIDRSSEAGLVLTIVHPRPAIAIVDPRPAIVHPRPVCFSDR